MGIEFKWDALTSSVHMFKKDDSDSKPATGPIDVVDTDGNHGEPSRRSLQERKPATGTGTGTGTTHLILIGSCDDFHRAIRNGVYCSRERWTLSPKVLNYRIRLALCLISLTRRWMILSRNC